MTGKLIKYVIIFTIFININSCIWTNHGDVEKYKCVSYKSGDTNDLSTYKDLSIRGMKTLSTGTLYEYTYSGRKPETLGYTRCAKYERRTPLERCIFKCDSERFRVYDTKSRFQPEEEYKRNIEIMLKEYEHCSEECKKLK